MSEKQYPMTLAAVADRLKMPIRTLRWHINIKKDLKAEKIGNLVVIDPREVERFEAEYERYGRR